MYRSLSTMLRIPAFALLWSLSAYAAAPDLSVAVTHTSAFLRGQSNAVYLIRVTNNGDTATTGPITVTESMPTGITIASMTGPGWSCLGATCTRSDSAEAGQMLPTISVLATIDANAPDSVNNLVTVTGGGDVNVADNTATDVTSIAAEGWLLGLPRQGYTTPVTHAPYDLSDVVAVDTSGSIGIALRKDGTVFDWGAHYEGPTSTATQLTGVIAVAVSEAIFFALKSDGTVTAWLTPLPAPHYLAPDTSQLSNIVAIRGAASFGLALRADGTLASLGYGYAGETNLPSSLANLTGLSCRYGLAAGLRADGSVVAWGIQAPATPASLLPPRDFPGH